MFLHVQEADVVKGSQSVQAFVERAFNSAQAFARHADALQAVYEARNPKAMTRMMSLFTKVRRRVPGCGFCWRHCRYEVMFAAVCTVDAPVQKAQPLEVPELDPEPFLFNATEVFDGMRRSAGLPTSAE